MKVPLKVPVVVPVMARLGANCALPTLPAPSWLAESVPVTEAAGTPVRSRAVPAEGARQDAGGGTGQRKVR